MSSNDCLRVARLYEKRGDFSEALGWTQRGCDTNDRDGVSYALNDLRRTLLLRLGRRQEVIDDAWRAYGHTLCSYCYGNVVALIPVERPPSGVSVLEITQEGRYCHGHLRRRQRAWFS